MTPFYTTPISSATFLPRYKNILNSFYSFYFSDKKKKDKKEKAEIFYQTNKEKLQKRSREYYRNLSEEENIQKRNYANIRNKNIPDADRGTRKEYIKNYYYERKNLFNDLINRAEKLGDGSLSI